MKIISVLLMCSALLTSCGSSKRSLESETKIAVSSDKVMKDSSSVNEQTKITEVDSTIEVSEVETVVYDTSVKDDTGKHPVLSVTKSVTTKGNNRTTDTDVVRAESKIKEELETTTLKEDTKIDQKQEVKETAVVKHWGFLIWGVAVILIALIVFVLRKKNIFVAD